MNNYVLYTVSIILIFSGLLCLRTAFKKQNKVRTFAKKEMPVTGKGSKTYLVYLGVVLIGTGIYILLHKYLLSILV